MRSWIWASRIFFTLVPFWFVKFGGQADDLHVAGRARIRRLFLLLAVMLWLGLFAAVVEAAALGLVNLRRAGPSIPSDRIAGLKSRRLQATAPEDE